jgi:Flp pilus assembly protein TadG
MANPHNAVVTNGEHGQVLAFFAVLLPIVLLPVGAYAVDAAFVATRSASLNEATAQAAESAAQQVDVNTFRTRSDLVIDAAMARNVAALAITESEPDASVESLVVKGAHVTVTTVERVTLPFNFLPVPAIRLEARASAQLVAGYDTPSSRLPLPTRSLLSTASGISSVASSSKQRSGWMNG